MSLPFQSSRHRSMSPKGFTLVELLVVIAIIGVLVGLLLPSVQASRESARRLSCSNNLKQVGLGLQSFADAKRCLPPGYLSGVDGSGNDTGPGWGWAAFLLPNMEQQAVYNAIQMNQPIEAAANASGRVQFIQTYTCPSDSPGLTWTAKKYDLSGNPTATFCEVASANYVGVFGTSEPGVDGDGVFYRNSKTRLSADIPDGTSKTMVVGERSFRLGQTTWAGAVTGATLFPQPPSIAPPILNNGTGMVLGHTGDGNGPGAVSSYVNQFSSQHTSGANFLFADGHVAVLQTSMKYSTYKALSTRAGGEQIEGDY